MSRTRLLDGVPGRVSLYHEADGDGADVIETRYDVEPVLQLSRRERDAGRHGNEMRKVANIPPDVLARAFKEGWFHDPQAWRKWANDPANAGFRVWEGTF